MAVKRDKQTLIDVARMYYIEGLDQATIGSHMGLTKSSVSRILSAAKNEGLIQVRIVGDSTIDRDRELEQTLESRFGLKRVLVASSHPSIDPLTATCSLAAQRFATLAPHAQRIGFGWGITMQRMIQEIRPFELGAEHVLGTLVGGMPTADTAPSGNNMIIALAERLHCRSERFDAPAVVESAFTWKALMRESSVRSALDRAQECQLAFVGIGTHGVHTSRLVIEAMKLSDAEREQFLAQHPAGDMCGHYFDGDGNALGAPSFSRVLGLNIEQLKQVPTVVGVAAGRDRLTGVLGALKTGVLDELCLDEQLARALVTARHKAASPSDEPEMCTCPVCGDSHTRL